MVGSIMHDVIGFLETIGMFDVILPFILIYVIVFALMERSGILGHDQIDKDTKVPKKNLNAIFAFASAFFAILSEQVVSAMNASIGPIMLLLLIIVLFMLLISSFKSDEGIEELKPMQRNIIIIVVLIAIVLIGLNSITGAGGNSWLDISWDYISANTNSGFVGSIVLLVGIGAFIMWISSDKKKPPETE